MRVAALGRTQLLYDAIEALAARGHEVVLIGTCPAAPEYAVKEQDFERLAGRLGCRFFSDAAINRPAIVQLIREAGAEVAISVNWLTLVGQEVIDSFPLGLINAHGGDLPRFRGNACQAWAILVGEPRVVLTLHLMTVDLDAGPVLLKRAYPLSPTTYVGDVLKAFEADIPGLFVEAVDGLATGALRPVPQPTDPSLSLRCFPRQPSDGLLRWEGHAEMLGRLVRASAEPYAGAFTYLEGRKLVVWRARPGALPYPYLGVPGQVAERRAGEVAVLCGEGVLVLEEVQLEGEARLPADQVLRSLRTRLAT